MDIKHVVVLMLENRSFDSMLGMLYQSEGQVRRPDGNRAEHLAQDRMDRRRSRLPVWKSPEMTPQARVHPDSRSRRTVHRYPHADPRVERGWHARSPARRWTGSSTTTCASRRDPTATHGSGGADALLHRRRVAGDQPVGARVRRVGPLACARHPARPGPTGSLPIPERRTATSTTRPTHFPYLMETVFNRLEDDAKVSWRVYFHDIPQSITLARLWGNVVAHFRYFERRFHPRCGERQSAGLQLHRAALLRRSDPGGRCRTTSIRRTMLPMAKR